MNSLEDKLNFLMREINASFEANKREIAKLQGCNEGLKRAFDSIEKMIVDENRNKMCKEESEP